MSFGGNVGGNENKQVFKLIRLEGKSTRRG